MHASSCFGVRVNDSAGQTTRSCMHAVMLCSAIHPAKLQKCCSVQFLSQQLGEGALLGGHCCPALWSSLTNTTTDSLSNSVNWILNRYDACHMKHNLTCVPARPFRGICQPNMDLPQHATLVNAFTAQTNSPTETHVTQATVYYTQQRHRHSHALCQQQAHPPLGRVSAGVQRG